MQNASMDEAQTGIKISGRNISNLRYADDTTLVAESEEELKSLLIKVKEESEKAGLKLNIHKTKIMASCPITSWEIDDTTMETVTDFIFLGSKIPVDGDCSHEIKRHLVLGRKAETWKMLGFLASRGEEFNLGPVTRLDHSELLCNKVLLKYKRDRESFWHRHQKGAEGVPPASLQPDVIQLLASC